MIAPPHRLQQLHSATVLSITGTNLYICSKIGKCSIFDAYSILRMCSIKTFLLKSPPRHCWGPLSLCGFCVGIFVQWSGCSTRSWLCTTAASQWKAPEKSGRICLTAESSGKFKVLETELKLQRPQNFPSIRNTHEQDSFLVRSDIICKMWAKD